MSSFVYRAIKEMSLPRGMVLLDGIPYKSIQRCSIHMLRQKNGTSETVVRVGADGGAGW